MTHRLAITGGTVVTSNEVIPAGIVLCEDGQITFVGAGQEAEPAANSRIMDATGQFVLPGFIDTHVHGSGGDDVMLEGPGFEHAALHLPAAGAPATLFDGTRTLPIVVARFGGDIVVGIGWSGGEIAIGRYDFERAIATTVGPHGEGTETFH